MVRNMTLDTALDTVEQLDTEEQKQLLSIVEKRLIEKERQEITAVQNKMKNYITSGKY